MYRNFAELTDAVRRLPVRNTLAVAAAEDRPVIEAALEADREGLAVPVFTGCAREIEGLIRACGQSPDRFRIIDTAHADACQRAVELVRDGEAQILMKGMLETKDFLGPIVKKENGLRTGHIMTHLVLFEVPNYKKLIMHTDGGMIMYPTLEDKKHIIEEANDAFHAMGYTYPKFAVLCAIEKYNEKMIETVDAAALQQMNERGEIPDCAVIGPISYDVAMSREIAQHKGFFCPYIEDFDCLIMPNMQAGNILGKCYIVTVGALMAGIIMGAKAPAVMTSRGSSAEEKFNSIAMASLVAAGVRQLPHVPAR